MNSSYDLKSMFRVTAIRLVCALCIISPLVFLPAAVHAQSPEVAPTQTAIVDQIEPARAASVTVEPENATMSPNARQNFTATVRDEKGKKMPNARVDWTTGSGGNVISSGKLTATFQATSVAGVYPDAVKARTDNVSGSADVTVSPGAVVTISVTPPLAVMPVDSTQSFTASGFDADNNPVPNLNVTWSVAPGSGAIESSGPSTATFRAGATPGLYVGAVRATSTDVTGTATVDVRAGSPATVVITPTAVALAINTTQLFRANVFDAYGNLLSLGVTWLLPSPVAGAIEASSAITVLFRAGTVAGTFANGLRASAGAVAATAAIGIPSGPASQLNVSAAPDAIVTDGLTESNIVVTVTDSYGNPVGAGAPVTLNVVQCEGACTLGASALQTDGNGRAATTLRSRNTSVTSTVTSQIRIDASIQTTSGEVKKSVVVNGSFTPYRSLLPAAASGEPDNHTACTALPVSVPATIHQSTTNAFNIYRFAASATTYNLGVYNYTSNGQILVYRVVEDNCATSGAMAIAFVTSVNITSPTTFLATLGGFTPGESYLLAVNTIGSLNGQSYTLTIWT